MSEIYTNFLYVAVKEVYEGKKGKKTDTELRIVYWPADDNHDECFVIYGKRPNSKSTGHYLPYRLVCYTKESVIDFAENVIDSQHNVEVELHQFYGESDSSEDEYNIDWKNTVEDSSTELVAYDIFPQTNTYGEYRLDFRPRLSSILNTLMDVEVV